MEPKPITNVWRESSHREEDLILFSSVGVSGVYHAFTLARDFYEGEWDPLYKSICGRVYVEEDELLSHTVIAQREDDISSVRKPCKACLRIKKEADG